ncbi:MAG: HAD-IA family hydrolase [Pseudomonadota bacterium]
MPDFLVLFDVDGTLVDSEAIIVDCMNAAFDVVSLPHPARRTVTSLVGLSLPRMVEALTPGADLEVQATITATYRVRFAEAVANGAEPPLYPGVPDGLAALRSAGFALGVATGKSRRGLDRVVKAYGWDDLFVTQQCADFHPSKPHPSMVRRALAETAIAEDRAVMVGDTIFDIEMANAADIPSIGVDWGYHEGERLSEAGAVAVVSDFESLVARIQEMSA